MKRHQKMSTILISIIMIIILCISICYTLGGKPAILNSNLLHRVYDNESRISKNLKLDKFNSIKIDADLDFIEIVKSNEYKVQLDYSERYNNLTCKVENEKLIIKENDRKKYNSHVNLGISEHKINSVTICLPEDVYLNDIVIYSSNSDITFKDVKSKIIYLESNYGDIDLNKVTSTSFYINSRYSNIYMKDIMCKELFTQDEYGSLEITNISANSLETFLKNVDIIINNSSIDEIFKIKNQHGNTEIKKCDFRKFESNIKKGNLNIIYSDSNNFKIENKEGNIYFKSNNKETFYNFYLSCEEGNIYLNEEKIGNNMYKDNNALTSVNVFCDKGNININLD
ncbi:hypothetical protein CHF27_004050 [Romboutsia maritimum]|uniref:DUF4097 domain-containing protein n=1 Tax=Romboutsia maritimum TaxID=2020948 RepID=A0A371IUV1_9FIRM|nr:DUF4097 family beta strand repeat-containing protein [Romboutsia maritimum]RDY24262.1 hypothetical protein CHF27_004050 [Romboutsia maritimum]